MWHQLHTCTVNWLVRAPYTSSTGLNELYIHLRNTHLGNVGLLNDLNLISQLKYWVLGSFKC